MVRDFVANQKALSNPAEMVSHSVNCSFHQDVESYDPILNPVLNRELRRTGGRVLITIGDQDIDLSPSFTIFLSTRDPTVGEILGFFAFKHDIRRFGIGCERNGTFLGIIPTKFGNWTFFLSKPLNENSGYFG